MKQFLSWEGRMNRASFFGNTLLVMVIGIAGIFAACVGEKNILGVIGFIIVAFAALRNMAITSRRLHDLNLSGMLVLPYFVVSGLAGKIEGLWVVGILATLALLLLPGNKMANQYGDVPGKSGE